MPLKNMTKSKSNLRFNDQLRLLQKLKRKANADSKLEYRIRNKNHYEQEIKTKTANHDKKL